MRSPARLLLFVLFTSGLCLALLLSTRAQQPGVVKKQVTPTPKPTSTPAPPIPDVKLGISSRSVEVNRPVTFSAQLSRRYPGILYRFYFGDGSDSGWQNGSSATHSYRAANSYKAYVDIGVPSVGPIKQAGGSQREPIEVIEPRSVQATVTLSANPRSAQENQPVTFVARAIPETGKARYRFDFGDQSSTDWQSGARASHQYKSAGKYSARVEVLVTVPNGKESSAGDTTTVQVTGAPVVKATVDLKINPSSVPLGLPVMFQAIPSRAGSNAVYRFNFGDGSPTTNWSSDSIQVHQYSKPGIYAAFVEMASSANDSRPSAASARQRLRVMPIGTNTNTNTGGNQNTNTGGNRNTNTGGNPNTYIGGNRNTDGNKNANSNSTPVANNNPGGNTNRNANTAGNTNSNQNANANAGNANSKGNANVNPNASGNANANANVNGNSNLNGNANASTGGNTNASGANTNANLSPTPESGDTSGGTSGPRNWWKYLIILAVILFAGYQIVSYLFAARPTFVPHSDPGDSKVAYGKPLSVGLQVDVDPNVTAGEFKIDTQGASLIKAKRTEP